MADESTETQGQPECCPPLEECDVCDALDFRFRLPFRPVVGVAGQRRIVPVEVILHFRLTRCSGPLSLGDILYTTTLLPGEQVRLFTSDRHSRFSFKWIMTMMILAIAALVDNSQAAVNCLYSRFSE